MRAYYESVAPGEENPRTLRRRGTALANRGQDLVAQGDLAAAAEFLRAAKAIGERLVSLQPDGMKGQKNLAAIHGDLGDIAARQNDLARALEEQQSASEILEAAAASGHRTELAYDIATSAYKLGKLDMQQGRTAAATAAFQRAILGYEEMLHVSPQFPCKIEMMAALNGLGEAERNSGKA
ncbi:MAG: tetratricopeptide repeat protein, partial [Chthoniobacterales bacterium]